MDEADRKKYKKLYLKTGRVYLHDMQRNIAALQKNPHNTTAVDNMHLCAHSLKGQSMLMGFSGLGLYFEVVEKIFQADKRQLLEIDPSLLNVLRDGIIKMFISFAEIETRNEELDLHEEIIALQKVAGTKIYI